MEEIEYGVAGYKGRVGEKKEERVAGTERNAGGLVGQSALITGASSGLGRAVAHALAAAGVAVTLVARGEEDLSEVAAEITRAGGRALSHPADLADGPQAAVAVGSAIDAFGRLDILVNAAGTDAPGTIEELDAEGWDRTLDVNLRAPFLLAKAAFPYMRASGRGTIVNVSSVAGKKGWAGAAAYCASKFGLAGLTQSLADEGREHGIRAIILYPGAMATAWGAWSPEERRDGDDTVAPPDEVLPAEQVADFIAWFAASPPGFVLTEGIVLPIKERML